MPGTDCEIRHPATTLESTSQPRTAKSKSLNIQQYLQKGQLNEALMIIQQVLAVIRPKRLWHKLARSRSGKRKLSKSKTTSSNAYDTLPY